MKCYRCKTTENLYYKGKGSYLCRSCNTELCRRYRAKDVGRAANQRAVAKYVAANKVRQHAWVAARTLPKQPCEVCGADKYVHKHHDDPSKPLDVMYLCPRHHKQRERQLKAQQLELITI